ncbi:hypothetical protein [Elizabethkingia miricola]|uniref:hypothetical protein n=1 Tax=Elizabethkingia miricola TaxID=172045 RepID=UPI00099A0C3C|nr:hypothetical protein [Elizabethkingia miricola]OPC38072.1 hypothetical protein BAX99_04795 [Elizabethkingia miricola]
MIKTINTRKYNILFIALSIWVTSCRGTDNAITDDNNNNGTPFNVIVNLTGAEIEESPLTKTAAIEGPKTSTTGVQQFIVPFDGISNATVTLIPQRSVSGTQTSINPIAGTPSITELGNNIIYKVAVYRTDGSFVDEKTFTYKTNNTNDQQGFMLNGDQTYTFVAYSVNSTSVVPAVTNSPRTLATDKLSGINGDLMYFRQNMTVSGNGKNYISVVLKHKFTKITTIIDATGVGNISLVNNARISPVGTSADIKLSDGSLIYNGLGTSAQVLNFKTMGSQKVTSDTNLLISNNDKNANPARLDIGTLIVGGTPQDNFSITDVNITPGNQYNLVVKLGPCRYDKYTRDFNLYLLNPSTNPGVINTEEMKLDPTDLGLIYDIYKLDDSFNITINGKKIASSEILFGESSGVAFQDGSEYSKNGIPQIWTMESTDKTKPLLRVVINKYGKVSLYGSKKANDRLYPLVLRNNTFQDVTWNESGINTIVSQYTLIGATSIKGTIRGIQSTQCTP